MGCEDGSMNIRLHPTSYNKLAILAETLALSMEQFCEHILLCYSSHARFLALLNAVKELPSYKNIFHAEQMKTSTLSVNLRSCALRNEQCEDILTAYAIGISKQSSLLLKEIPVE